MPASTDTTIAALHAAVTAIPEDQRAYATRFVSANAHRKPKELMSRWEQDQKDREYAANLEAHRRLKVLSQANELGAGITKETIAKIVGVDTSAKEGAPTAETEAKV